jgi:hypothetical protein
VSRRIVHIHWIVDRLRPRAITITVNGRVVARRPGRARDALIDLRGMSTPLVKVVVRARVAHHRSLGTVRRYRTCVGRIVGPPLRTLRLR